MNILNNCVIGLLMLLYVAFNYYLSTLSDENFLKYFFIPFKDIVSISVVTYVVYFFVEHKNDTRNKKNALERITRKMIKKSGEERMYGIKDSNDIKHITVIQKLVFNEIDIISSYAEEFHIEKEVNYCKEEFNEFWVLISNHINDLDYLQKSENELFNHLTNVLIKLEKITLKIYD